MLKRILNLVKLAGRAIYMAVRALDTVKFVKRRIKEVKHRIQEVKQNRTLVPEWARVWMERTISAVVIALPLLLPLFEIRGRAATSVVLSFISSVIKYVEGDYNNGFGYAASS